MSQMRTNEVLGLATIVAGPPGSGKTTRFPVAEFNVASFNADSRAAQLNDGSFLAISKEIRSQVNVEFQKWILDHISARSDSAILLPAARTCAVRASNSVSFSTSIASRDSRFTEAVGSGLSEAVGGELLKSRSYRRLV